MEQLEISTRRVVDLDQYLRHVCLAASVRHDVWEKIDNLYCWGSNPDTLLDVSAVNKLLEPYDHEVSEEYGDLWFSLGC